MTYIINPWVFYWMELAEWVKSIALIVAILAGIAWIVVFIASIEGWDEDQAKLFSKALKIIGATLFISLVLCIVTPSKDTCIQMLIAKQATFENATWTIDTLKAAVDYIVDAMKELK